MLAHRKINAYSNSILSFNLINDHSGVICVRTPFGQFQSNSTRLYSVSPIFHRTLFVIELCGVIEIEISNISNVKSNVVHIYCLSIYRAKP